MDFFETHAIFVRMVDPKEGTIVTKDNKQVRVQENKLATSFYNFTGGNTFKHHYNEYICFHKNRKTGLVTIIEGILGDGDVCHRIDGMNQYAINELPPSLAGNQLEFRTIDKNNFESSNQLRNEKYGVVSYELSVYKTALERSHFSLAANEVPKKLPTFSCKQVGAQFRITKTYSRGYLMQYSDFLEVYRNLNISPYS